MARETLSQDSIRKATISKAKLSEHGGAGAAGVVQDGMAATERVLRGEALDNVIAIPTEGDQKIRIGLSWNNVVYDRAEGLINRLFKKMTKAGVDLDLGCLYEMKDGNRGAVQAFGEMFGAYDKAPYICLSGDERTGNTEGDDEFLRLNGAKWSEVERILIYTYIYRGPQIWRQIEPDVCIRVPGSEPIHIRLNGYQENVPVCALLSIHNQNGGLKLTAHTEYFQGHAEMDRAFGYGLRWEEGSKE